MQRSTSTRNSQKSEPLSSQQFSRAVRAALTPVANPAMRGAMRAYMKNQFDYLGIKASVRRAAVTTIIRGQKNAVASDLLRYARALWSMPEREYQYVAVDLLARHANNLTLAQMPELFALVQKKSWWDTVDALSSVIGKVIKNACSNDRSAQCAMDKALKSQNLWVRRVAIIHQLGWRKQTDSQRLFAYATTCAHEKEFFIRKAIAWALRDYARHAPAEVRKYLRANHSRLSSLTIREAGKHIL